jgi:hypothetical protein
MSTVHINAVALAELVRRGLLIADAAAVADIETEAVAVQNVHQRWYDVRPMLDVREHCGELIDLATETLAYAEQRGLIQRHLVERHMVRIVRRAGERG